MILVLSLSAKKAGVRIEDCTWYRFQGKRSVFAENDDYDLEIATNNVFGIKSLRKGKFAVLHKDLPTEIFHIDAATARSLMGRSRPYNGRVNGTKVNTTLAHTQRGGSKTEPEPVAYEVDNSASKENKELTEMIREADCDGINRAKFIKKVLTAAGDDMHVYDIKECYDRTSHQTSWDVVLEKALLKTIKGDYLIAAMIKEEYGPVLVVME